MIVSLMLMLDIYQYLPTISFIFRRIGLCVIESSLLDIQIFKSNVLPGSLFFFLDMISYSRFFEPLFNESFFNSSNFFLCSSKVVHTRFILRDTFSKWEWVYPFRMQTVLTVSCFSMRVVWSLLLLPIYTKVCRKPTPSF